MSPRTSQAPERRALQFSDRELASYLQDVRALVLAELQRIVPVGSAHAPILYDLMLDYPMRSAKTMRPAICIASCRALGGALEPVLPSAAVLELYHNAFLIHDDVEDGSEKRRDQPTLHENWGIPIAINVGDAMLALALTPLLDNMRLLGMGKALRILQAIATMARESAEGQAIELAWIREGRYEEPDDAYGSMAHKKTALYSFVTPIEVGAIVAGAVPEQIAELSRFAGRLGLAFQIQDDVLNLAADETRYGKEIGGDLWEGKLTLILLHALRQSSPDERERARAILHKRRPDARAARTLAAVTELATSARELMTSPEHRPLHDQIVALQSNLSAASKTHADVEFLWSLVQRNDSLGYAREIALRHAEAAAEALAATASWLRPSTHRSFLESLVAYVNQRDR